MLSNQQIAMLELYCGKMGVKYYDVKQELVDHMCEWIEHEQEKNGSDFETAFSKMQNVFSKSDLKNMVRSKAKAVRGMVSRNFVHAFIEFFSWPKILIVAFLFFITLMVNRFTDISRFPSISLYVFNIVNLSFSLGRSKTIYHNRFDMLQKLVSKKQVMRMQMIFMSPSFIYLILSLLYLQDVFIPLAISKTALFLFPVLVLVTLAWRSASIAANEKIRHDYPDAFILR